MCVTISACCLINPGASQTKYLEHLEEIRRSEYTHTCTCTYTVWDLMFFLTDYRYRKDEIFKRLKVTTFAQLVSYMYTVVLYMNVIVS